MGRNVEERIQLKQLAFNEFNGGLDGLVSVF